MKKLKRHISKLDEESFVRKYREVRSEFYRTFSNALKKGDIPKETKKKLKELSNMRELLQQELNSRKDLNLERAINEADEDFLEESEIEYNTFLEPIIEKLGESGIIDEDQWKAVYENLMETENMRIIQRYAEIEAGITLDKAPKPEGFNLILKFKKE